MRYLPLLTALLLFGCATDTQREDPSAAPGLDDDTTVVQEPLYEPGSPAGERELDARTVILQDEAVREAQVIMRGDTVHVSAVLSQRVDEDLLQLKAEQFVAAAQRAYEQAPPTQDPETLVGPTQLAYEVSIRDAEGARLYDGFKAPASTRIERRPAGEAAGGAQPAPGTAPR